jgi:hypothetical protein
MIMCGLGIEALHASRKDKYSTLLAPIDLRFAFLTISE